MLFFHWKREAEGKDEATIAKIAASILRYEASIGYGSFARFNTELAVAFKRELAKAANQRTGKPLSKSTIDGVLRDIRDFFQFLAGQRGYKKTISYSDAKYFNNYKKDSRIAHTHRNAKFPTLEQAKHAFDSMPVGTDIERRNRALFAFTMITATRITAISTLRLKHIDLVEGCVFQDAREVYTKGGKTFTSWFIPIDDIYLKEFKLWVEYLRTELLFGGEDALFPKPNMVAKPGQGFQVAGLSRESYSNSNALRQVIKNAFSEAGLPIFAPHSFRKTIVSWADDVCTDWASRKAVSLNLGQADIGTAAYSYLPLSEDRQAELIRGLGT